MFFVASTTFLISPTWQSLKLKSMITACMYIDCKILRTVTISGNFRLEGDVLKVFKFFSFRGYKPAF